MTTIKMNAEKLSKELMESVDAGSTIVEWSNAAQKKYPTTPLTEFTKAIRYYGHVISR